VSFGGAEVGADGAWRPQVKPPLAGGADLVRVPSATAALVTVRAP
jgi:hypothetical protein